MLLTLALAALPAHADPVEIWAYDEFENEEWISGTDGWESGFEEDPWIGYQGQDATWAMAYTDAGVDDAPGDWGDGGAYDNFLVNEAAEAVDGRFEAVFYTADDDSLGVVFGYKGPNDYYMFVLCGEDGGDQPDCPLDLRDETGSAIVHVGRGGPEILAETSASYQGGREGAFGLVSVEHNDGALVVIYEEGGVQLTAEVTEFAGMAGVGFWSYNSGAEDGSWTGFSEPVLYALDEDNDGVVDDDDNCEQAANAEQTDGDADGIGDACDDSTDPGDDTGTPGGDDTGGGPDGGNGPNKGDGLTISGSCDGCESGNTGVLGLVPLALALVGARRRRRLG